MVVCTHCYEMVTKENRRAVETCPFCFHILPEPEATPLPEPEPEQQNVPYVDPTLLAMAEAQAAAAAAPKSRTPLIAGVIILALLLAGGAFFFLGGKDDGKSGGSSKPTGPNPKLVPSIKNLNAKVQEKSKSFFVKTCKTFQEANYSFKTSLVLHGENWNSLIEVGSGAPDPNEDWYLCPLKIVEIRSKADMKILVETRFQSGGLFGSAKNFGKVALEGVSLKPTDFTLPTSETQIENWGEVKDIFYIKFGFLYRTSPALKALNGAFKQYSLRNKNTWIGMNGTKLIQVEAQGSNKVFGKFEAHVPAWFGESFTKELRDWGTGCNNDVTEQFRKIAQDLIDAHDDLEEFKDSKELKAYLDKAEKAGRDLCLAMPKVAELIDMYDQGKTGEIPRITEDLKTALEAAKKAFTADLEAAINAMATQKP